MEQAGTCWDCNTPLQEEELGRQSTCPHCGRYTHVCRNCRFFDPGHYNDCREPQAERVVDKDKANFCDYFKVILPKKATAPVASDPFAAANALFRK